MSSCIVRLQIKCAPVFSLGLYPLPLLLLHVCQQDVRFGEFRVQFQCLPGSTYDFWTYFTRCSAEEDQAELAVCICQSDVSGRKSLIPSYRLVKVSNGHLDVSPVIAFVQREPPLEITLINFR